MIRFFVIFITLLALTLPALADITIYESYESYNKGAKNIFDKDDPDLWTPNCNSGNYYEIVESPVRAGNQAIKFYNHRVSESNGYRCENAAWAGRGSGHLRYFTIGEEYWLGFSIYLPVDFVCDGCGEPNYNNEIHGQIHAFPDRKSTRRSGYDDEAWRNPPISLSIKEDNWRIAIRSDSAPITVNKNYDRNKLYVIGSWLGDKGKWTDWVFHFKLDYTANGVNGGFLKVYKNGILVVNDTGGNCYNDLLGPYPTFGTYKFSWKSGPTDTDTRIVYFDEVKVGNKNSSLSEVSPNGTPIPPKPILPAPSYLKISPAQ